MGELHEKDAAFKYGWELYFGVDSAHVDAPLSTPLDRQEEGVNDEPVVPASTSTQDTPDSASVSQTEGREEVLGTGNTGELHEKDAAFKYGWELYFGADSAHVDAPLPTPPDRPEEGGDAAPDVPASSSAKDKIGSERESLAEAHQTPHSRGRPGTLLIPYP
ncbi:hypothetical protein T484DRAFT_1740823 [Baffinella frigidus]|nr:hypothetical protein T484DRAFT_1740823 [Cryptophyta sp. CCMP2293]